MTQSAIKAQRLQGENNNQSDDALIRHPSGSPGCFGAASIFDFDSTVCGACPYFEKCADECLVTLEKIKGVVDTSELLKRHDAGRKARGLSVRVPSPPATPTPAQTEQPTVIDCEPELDELYADELTELFASLDEVVAQITSRAIPKRSEPPVTGEVAQCNSADLEVVKPMHEAKDVIARAMDISKSNPADTVRIAAEPIETISPIKPVESFEPVEPTASDPLLRLKALVAELHIHKNYTIIRLEFVQISAILNEQRLLAPAFRPQPKLGLIKGNPIYMDIHRDQIFIDCHWLYCRREHVMTRDEELQPLFDLDKAFSLRTCSRSFILHRKIVG